MKNASIKMIFVLIFIIAIGLYFINSSSAKIDPKNFAGMWLFDENNGDEVKDSSGNNNHGKIVGKAKWEKGVFGSALVFDGSTFVQIEDSDTLDMGQEVTIVSWIKTEKVMKDMWADRQAVIGKHYTEYEVGIYMQGQIHTYTSNISGAGDGYDEGIMTTMANKLPDKEGDWELKKWYHVTWVLKGTQEVAYVNGIKLGEHNKPNKGTKGGNHTLEIGRRQGGGLSFIGTIDETAILNVALGEDDINAIMKNGLKAGGLAVVSISGKLANTWANIKKY